MRSTFEYVDDTLALQGAPRPGPVTLNDILTLRLQGIPTGVCGNFLVLFKVYPDWWKFFSFYGPTELVGVSLVAHHQYKHLDLLRIAKALPASRYVMVGNKQGDPNVAPKSQDDIQARLAKWEFIKERDFANGRR